MKVIATVIYPVRVEVEVGENASEDFIREALVMEADTIINDCYTPSGIIQECSIPSLEE